MAGFEEGRAHYWERHTRGDGAWRSGSAGPPGEHLAALRRGVGREPGTVPSMWPFYSTLNEQGQMTSSLRAEHVALTLFAIHQRSQLGPVHRKDVGVGRAVRTLRDSERFSEEAVDRRFTAAANCESLGELSVHLRGLVTQMRSLSSAGLDYTRLFRDLRDWQLPQRRAAVRRRWGGEYFAGLLERHEGAESDPSQTGERPTKESR
ncbi:MAG TPA: type I-E CRISPR-associated protein Cse2/CasB [Anaerolineae bacterium]|nr:type I-E CRISPR-associated protein Cse2/CasB [Anaerolineae bacterium]